MVADMSSDIFSRPIDVSKYICIYGGAQKNLAPAGVTFVIVKNDAVGKVSRYIPSMLNYQTHIDNGSMFNTPPVVPIYAALLNLRWIKAQGGVKEMERRAITKQMFMRERSSLAAVPTNILLRSISAYNISAFSMARRSISFTPPCALIQRRFSNAA